MAVVGLGAGGHSKVVLEILRLIDAYEVVGLLDPKEELWGTEVLGAPVLGDDGLLAELRERGVTHAFIGLGGVGDNGPRRRLYEIAMMSGLSPVRAIHPSAVVSSSAEIGNGVTVAAGALINPSARIGDNVIVNTGAIVEHDCVVGDHVHVATGARLASTVRIDVAAHIGAGATVRQSITIGEGAVVGAGAAVVKDVPPRTTVVGVPARPLPNRDIPAAEHVTQGQRA